MFTPRPKQAEVLAYTGGKMGVSAVPGSGKTHVLSALAAKLVAEADLGDEQEVLIVTLVNSAVDNFARRVDEFVKERGLLPHVGYRVRTLHGLAYDIVRERPSLVGLSDDFQIVDEREANQILQDAVEAWLAAYSDSALPYLDPNLDDRKAEWVNREQWPRLVLDIALDFIRMAKDLQVTPDMAFELLSGDERPPLVEMGFAIYADYQRALNYRGAVDYDDLIRLALLSLQSDAAYLQRLRYRWPYILEDEAQDSSRLQEQILRLLSGPDGNWVRVGDPNQAIYETFTTASPRYLREFLAEPGVAARELPNSGRSTASIMALANYLVEWSREEHPVPWLRDALAPTVILPTPEGDPQPNPEDRPDAIHLVRTKLSPPAELESVVNSVSKWVQENPEKTVAVLVPRNDRGELVVNALRGKNIEVVELLKSTRATRDTAGALGNVIAYLADPASPRKLSRVYEVWRRADREDPDANERMKAVAAGLNKVRQVEDFVWPRPDPEDLAAVRVAEWDAAFDLDEHLREFRTLIRRWQMATTLPIDQLLLTVGQDLFQRSSDLAVTHKLAIVLRQVSESHPHWRLPELNQELIVIAKNERKFLGMADEDTGFDPEAHKGKVVVITAHKAKGLEWDRVYLMSVNNYDFPSALPGDSFMSERWYVRDRLNLEAEELAQLEALAANRPVPPVGEATERARLDYAAERLRLLYVGITRAKTDLIVTWNTGKSPVGQQQPAVPLIALQAWWENVKQAT
jgi:DNA helicase II / ATP-dependent DNA helicase PcrA